MNDKIELAPRRLRRRENRIDGRGLGHVAMADHQRVDLLGERLDALFERIALVGQCKFGTVRTTRLGDSPGNRPVVGHPHDQAALAAHQT